MTSITDFMMMAGNASGKSVTKVIESVIKVV